jgi:DNA integrity scanning protein DisA with diadenylate cyclase activity
MEGMDVINRRLEGLELTAQQMQRAINSLCETVDSLKKHIGDLERELSDKVGVTDIKQVVKQSEIIKKLNDSKSIGMDCKVGVSLDGRVVAESIYQWSENK